MDPEILDEMFRRTHPLFWPVLIVQLVWSGPGAGKRRTKAPAWP